MTGGDVLVANYIELWITNDMDKLEWTYIFISF